MRCLRRGKNFIFPVLLAAVILFSSVSDAFAAVTQAQIDEVKRKRNQVSEEKMAQQQVIDELSAQRDDIIDQKMALEQKVAITREQINLNNQEIDLYEDMIAEKAEEVDEARAREEEQLRRYRMRYHAERPCSGRPIHRCEKSA